MTPEERDAAERVVAAVRDGRDEELRLALHPYVHWTAADGARRRPALALDDLTQPRRARVPGANRGLQPLLGAS